MSASASPDSDAVIANPLRASGLLDAATLERARQLAHAHGQSLVDTLLRENFVKEGEFLRVFASLYSTRFVKAEKLKGLVLDEQTLDRVGVRAAERLRMCPIRWDPANQELHVVAGVPLAAALEPELRQMLGARQVIVFVATPGAIAALIRKTFYRQDDAFDLVTVNGAGPQMPVTVLLEGEDEHTPIAMTLADAPDEDTGPGFVATTHDTQPVSVVLEPGRRSSPSQPQLQPEKTVMVDLEALTIATLRRENARYRIAQEFNRRVSLERNVERMVDRILEVIFELLAADGAAVWLVSGVSVSKTRDGAGRVDVPHAVIDQAVASAHGILTNNALVDERFDRSQSVMARGVKSMMAVPLRTRSGVIGILYVESTSMLAAFTEEDLPLLDAVAMQASILLDNAALVAQVEREVEARLSLSRFLSQAAIDEVMSGRMKVHLEGQSQEITVLFADLRGFTSMAAQMKPEEVVRFLNTFFSEAVDAVENHGGIVDKFIGDCVMAVWGAVTPRPDDARSAVRAALSMVERAHAIRVNGVRLELGVGINSGNAIVGAIGGKNRSDYTAIGSTVNLAARLCGIAEAGEVLVTAETLMRAGPGVLQDASAPVVLKGLDTPMVPYRVRSIIQPLQLSQVLRGGAARKA